MATFEESLINEALPPRTRKRSRGPSSWWGWTFFWNPYSEDWPEYGLKEGEDVIQEVEVESSEDMSKRIPTKTLKCALRENPNLLHDEEREPDLTFKRNFSNIKFFLALIGLGLNISALMFLGIQFEEGVEGHIRNAFPGGEDVFDTFILVLAVMPLMFAAMIPFMYNSMRSKEAFSYCLARGYLLDFPEQMNPTYFATHRIALAYAVGVGTYVAFAIFMFIRCQATPAIWLLFLSNMISGIGSVWVRHLRVEHDLVSLTKFVHSMDNRGKIDGLSGLSSRSILDEHTIARAANVLKGLKPLRCRAPYKDHTWMLVFKDKITQDHETPKDHSTETGPRPSTTRWRYKAGNTKKKWAVRLLALFIAALFAVAAILGVGYRGLMAKDKQWDAVSRCTQVCHDQSAFNEQDENCFNCMCACVTAFSVSYSQAHCKLSFNGKQSVLGCDYISTCQEECGTLPPPLSNSSMAILSGQ